MSIFLIFPWSAGGSGKTWKTDELVGKSFTIKGLDAIARSFEAFKGLSNYLSIYI